MKLTGWRRAIMVACCIVLLFVLLCPYTPSPTPLAKFKVTLTLAVMALLLPLSLLQLRTTVIPAFEPPRPAAVPLITLNCSLLC